MKSEEKIKELAEKLLHFSQNTEGNERENAERLLHALMQKHRVTVDEIGKTEEDWVRFRVTRAQLKFFRQIAASVLGNVFECQYYGGWVSMFLPPSVFIEVQAKFNFFWAEYEKGVADYYTAFVYRNKLEAKADDFVSFALPTDDEKEQFARARKLMSGIVQKVMPTDCLRINW